MGTMMHHRPLSPSTFTSGTFFLMHYSFIFVFLLRYSLTFTPSHLWSLFSCSFTHHRHQPFLCHTLTIAVAFPPWFCSSLSLSLSLSLRRGLSLPPPQPPFFVAPLTTTGYSFLRYRLPLFSTAVCLPFCHELLLFLLWHFHYGS